MALVSPFPVHTPPTVPPTATVAIEVAPGELIDKLTILAIKLERITDAVKFANVYVEHETLDRAFRESIAPSDELNRLIADLRLVNETLWDVEDRIRDCERAGEFSATFVALARSVYKTNDRRAALKKDINTLLGSRLVEEKSYAHY